jgi:hypothetical protein
VPRKPEVLDSKRAQGMMKEEVDMFYEFLGETYKDGAFPPSKV